MMNEKHQATSDNANTNNTNTDNTNTNNTNNTNQYLKTHIKNDGRTFFDHHVPKELSVSKLYSVTGFTIFCVVFDDFVVVVRKIILRQFYFCLIDFHSKTDRWNESLANHEYFLFQCCGDSLVCD